MEELEIVLIATEYVEKEITAMGYKTGEEMDFIRKWESYTQQLDRLRHEGSVEWDLHLVSDIDEVKALLLSVVYRSAKLKFHNK